MNDDKIKTAGDIAASFIAFGTLLKWLPLLASGLSVIWMGLRIFDWVEDRIKKRKTKNEG